MKSLIRYSLPAMILGMYGIITGSARRTSTDASLNQYICLGPNVHREGACGVMSLTVYMQILLMHTGIIQRRIDEYPRGYLAEYDKGREVGKRHLIFSAKRLKSESSFFYMMIRRYQNQCLRGVQENPGDSRIDRIELNIESSV